MLTIFFCTDTTPMQTRIGDLEERYAALLDLSAERRNRLEESRRLWQFFWDMAEEEAWIKEKEQILSSGDIGRDLTSINLLLNKHRVSAHFNAISFGNAF